MEISKNKPVSFKSLWLWWLLTTLIYSLLSGGIDKYDETFFGHIAGFTGLFVPYGPQSLIMFASPPSWISLLVFLALMFFINRWLDKQNFSLTKRRLINLLVLLILTTIVDFIRFTPFESWRIFFDGSYQSIYRGIIG